ncbi:CBD9-like protein [Clathrospora elynae]|uniref:CBD9-like protein n=1 Tax=Clathrospora elynae TaxID=706981 RepID=A0A6A5SP41_9PLEO|nr:CBD9-like protein [Clathrospora elynae]
MSNRLLLTNEVLPTTYASFFNFRHILLTTLLACLITVFTRADDEPTSSTSQLSTPFVDQTTGLPMERFFGARTSFAFALALPATPPLAGKTSSFIGQLSFPLVNGQGWGAMGLTGDMEGNFILAAWPDSNGGVMASFRQATNEDNPPEVTGNFSVRPLPDGVVANATSLSYTFLCENCIDASLGLAIDTTTGNAVMGWALSEKSPSGSAADPGAFLGFHERGFGPFTARLAAAATPQFDAVAATALSPVAASKKALAAVAGAAGAGSGDEGGDEENDSGDESDDDDD